MVSGLDYKISDGQLTVVNNNDQDEMGRRVSVVTNPSMCDLAGHTGETDPRDFLVGARCGGAGTPQRQQEVSSG